MMYFTKNKEDCTGCTACKAVCPKKCITMQPDEKGFFYPEADLDICIQCGLCENVCPNQHPRYIDQNGNICTEENSERFLNTLQYAVTAITKDDEVWKNSTSGGAFSEICNVLNRKAIAEGSQMWVYGAAFDGLVVKHCGHRMPDIQGFRKSKYVQSDMQNCFYEIKTHLQNQEQVLFSGTPCQVEGLRAFLGKPYENLFCIDLICHGVGSPSVFKRYLDECSQTDKVKKYTFRIKFRKYGNYQRYLSEITRESGKIERILIDDYNKLFLNQLCLRNCCGENCKYRKIHRQGDITLADCNNFTRNYPDIYDDRGYSTIVVNTTKGKAVLGDLPDFMVILPADLDDVKRERRSISWKTDILN